MALQLSADATGRSSSGFAKAEMVHVHVGLQKEKFLVHKHLLLEASMTIRGIFEEEDSKEAETGIVRMPKEDPKVFSFVVDWMYKAHGRDFKAVKWADKSEPLSLHLKLWMLGYRWDITELQNWVMRQLHAWRMKMVDELFEELRSTIAKEKDIISGPEWNTDYNDLADWIVDMYYNHGCYEGSLDKYGPDAFDHRFLLELAMRGMRRDLTDYTEVPERYLV